MFSAADTSQVVVCQALRAAGLTVYDELPDAPRLPFVGMGDAKDQLISNLPVTWQVDMELSVMSNAKGWMQASQICAKVHETLHNLDIPAGNGYTGGSIMVGSMDRSTPADEREVKIEITVWLQCA